MPSGYFEDLVIELGYVKELNMITRVDKVIFNGPATIVCYTDGFGHKRKSIVKCAEGDAYDKEKGFAMAMLKIFLGKDFNRYFKLFVPEEE